MTQQYSWENRKAIRCGGSAFPRPYSERSVVTAIDHDRCEAELGMTLRDYFAAMALQGFLTNRKRALIFDSAAKAAYKYADAMLKARDI